LRTRSRRPWVALERLAGACSCVLSDTPLKRYPRRYPVAFAAVAVAVRVWRNALTWLMNHGQCASRASFLPAKNENPSLARTLGGDPPGITLAGSPTDHR
jgi:hypothetical protein